MTEDEFYQEICDLPGKFQNRDLETYLLALLRLVQNEKSNELDSDRLLELLKSSFTSEPKLFDPEWLKIIEAPDDNLMSKKFTNLEIKSSFDKSVVSNSSGKDYTINVLKFQISELHKMKNKQLQDDMRYFGVQSETGNLWYNFDPFTNLECGTRCLIDGGDDNGTKEFVVSWQFIGELLEMGRIYE